MITPNTCPVCGSSWRGGAALPGSKLKPQSRVFYDCGSHVSYDLVDFQMLANGYTTNPDYPLNADIYKILVTNCDGTGRVEPCDGL